MKYINTTSLEYPLSLQDIRAAHPHTSIPRDPDEDALATLGFAVVHDTPRMAHNQETETVQEGPPVTVNNRFESSWVITDLSADEIQQGMIQRKRQAGEELNKIASGLIRAIETPDDKKAREARQAYRFAKFMAGETVTDLSSEHDLIVMEFIFNVHQELYDAQNTLDNSLVNSFSDIDGVVTRVSWPKPIT